MTLRAFVLFPALAMMLGWGLRGFIGGGPFGAMIPGAMVALTLCLLLKTGERECARIAAFGAVGVGFGGEMTYGQTVGFAVAPESFLWGVAGLALKGAVWGLLGGAIVGMALARERPSMRDSVVGFALMLGGVWTGWKLVNQPKLIYFSNRLDRPREEVWAGLTLGALVLLAWLALRGFGRAPSRFAFWGTVGGGVGFGSGGVVIAAGRLGPEWLRWLDWWKGMEFSFGFCFGMALGVAAWQSRKLLLGAAEPEKTKPAAPTNAWLDLALAAVLLGALFYLEASLRVRFSYAVVGAGLLTLALLAGNFSWHIALTATYFAFAMDLAEYYSQTRQLGSVGVGWAFALASTAVTARLIIRRYRQGLPMAAWSFLLITWTAVSVACVKMLMHPDPMRAGGLVTQAIFTASAVISHRVTTKRYSYPAI